MANPTDLVKVRMQAEGKLPAGAARRYPSAVGAYFSIARTEGTAALWTGLGPNIGRNAIVNAAELASYDAIKQALIEGGMADGVPVHLAAGLGAGFFAVVCGSPVDVVKSRIMGEFLRWGGVGWTTHTHFSTQPPFHFPKRNEPAVACFEQSTAPVGLQFWEHFKGGGTSKQGGLLRARRFFPYVRGCAG